MKLKMPARGGSAFGGKPKQKIFQIICSVYLLIVMLFGFVHPAEAQITKGPLTPAATSATSLPQYNGGVDTSIKDYLCVPDDSNLGGALYDCIGRVYRFGVAFGAIAVVFFIVYAGYMYIVGGEAAKGRAKGMIWSSLTGMGIILGSYILLRFINPSLVEFKTIQPPIFTAVLPKCEDVGLGTNCILSDGTVHVTNGGAIVAGYNIGAYATDPNHEAAIARIYGNLASKDFSNAQNITTYMKSIAPSTPLTGEMVLASSRKYNSVDPKMIVAMMQQDSSFGTLGKGARTHNPGNVGNDDTGKTVDYGTWEKGVDAVADWLNKHRA